MRWVPVKKGLSNADQAALPLVDENVGDDRGPLGPYRVGGRGIARLELLELVAARGRGEQGAQLVFPLPQSLLRLHGLSSLGGDRGCEPGRGEEARRWARRDGPIYLRWRIFARMRRFFRPTLRRPLRFFIGFTRSSSRDVRHGCYHAP